MVGKPTPKTKGRVRKVTVHLHRRRSAENLRWAVAYYRHLALGASYEESYDQANYELSTRTDNRPWYGDYTDVEPAENRIDYIGF